MTTSKKEVATVTHDATESLEVRIETWRQKNPDLPKNLVEAINKHLSHCVVFLPLAEAFSNGHTSDQVEEWTQQITDQLLNYAIEDCVELQMPIHQYIEMMPRRIHDVLKHPTRETSQ